MSEQSIPVIRQRFLEDMRIKGLAAQNADDVPCVPCAISPGFSDARLIRLHPRIYGHFSLICPKNEHRCGDVQQSAHAYLSFFFSVTCAREGMKRYMRYQRVPKKDPGRSECGGG